jgi:hypothetical protein
MRKVSERTKQNDDVRIGNHGVARVHRASMASRAHDASAIAVLRCCDSFAGRRG